MTTATADRRQGLTSNVAIKKPCKAATTANITLSGEQTIDGVACVAGDRVLVMNQTNGADNGVYDVNSSAWTRSLDWDGSGEIVKGTLTYVHSGSTNIGLWKVTTADTITIGTTSVSFSKIV